MAVIDAHIRRSAFGSRARAEVHQLRLSLQPTVGGWALLDAHHQVVFRADGLGARRRCLQQANALGVLCLRFDEQPAAPSKEIREPGRPLIRFSGSSQLRS